VYAEDPNVPGDEPVVPFTLGVRISNNGHGAAANTTIESAQPRITENDQGLLIGFQIDGGYVDDQPTQPSLLLDFGDIHPGQSRMGRWIMRTTLSGEFVSFDASYTHAAELGGELTSLLDVAPTHLLAHDVLVDPACPDPALVCRDDIRDFLAQEFYFGVQEDNPYRVYESDGRVTEVMQQFDLGPSLAFPAQAPGTFVYARAEIDSYEQGITVSAVRQDGSHVAPENVWLSKRRNGETGWLYYINLFEVNSASCNETCAYTVTWNGTPPTGASLSGLIFADANANGVQDEGEARLADFGVTLSDGQVTLQRASAIDGSFQFDDLAAGTYQLTPSLTAPFVNGMHEPGTAGGTVSSLGISEIAIPTGFQATGYRLAMVPSEATAAADLAVTSITTTTEAPDVGEIFTVTVDVANIGPDSALARVLLNTMPSGLDVLAVNPSVGTFDPQTGVWNVGPLAASGAATMAIQLRANEVLDAAISTQIQSVENVEDPDINNNVRELSIHASPSANVELQAQWKVETRLLVLVGCLNRSQGSCAPERATDLDAYLSQVGVEHVVTTRASDFVKELRSGHWNTYWLDGGIGANDASAGGGDFDGKSETPFKHSAESENGGLSDDAIAELRMAIYRGETLWIDGSRDIQSIEIESWTGLSYLGQRTENDEVISFNPDYLDFDDIVLVGPKPRYSISRSIPSLATYTGSEPAISMNSMMGTGHVILFAFDLVGALVSDANLIPLFALISETAQPQLPTIFMADGYVPTSLQVVNLGPEVPVVVSADLPPGSSAVIATPLPDASSTPSHIVWPTALDVTGTFGASIGLRVPATDGSHALALEVTKQTGAAQVLDSASLSINVRSTDQQFQHVAAGADPANFPPGQDADLAADAGIVLENARLARLDGQINDALGALLKADSVLAGIYTGNIEALRADLAWLLQAVEREWYTTLSSCNYSVSAVIEDPGISFIPSGEFEGARNLQMGNGSHMRLGQSTEDGTGTEGNVEAFLRLAPGQIYQWSFTLDTTGQGSFAIAQGSSVLGSLSYPPPGALPGTFMLPPGNGVEVSVEATEYEFGTIVPRGISVVAEDIGLTNMHTSIYSSMGGRTSRYFYNEVLSAGLDMSGTIEVPSLLPGEYTRFRIRPGSISCRLSER